MIPDFCLEASAWFEEWYDRLFSGENIEKLESALAQRQEEFQNSPFFLDWLMLTWLTTGNPPENVKTMFPSWTTGNIVCTFA
ncbi:MAG: hypothetical protein ACLSHU_07825 [Oscillospiraceae bacterium]